MKIVLVLLIISLFFNFLLIRYDVFPFYYPKIKKKLFPNKLQIRDRETLEKLIIEASLKAISTNKSLMVWSDPQGVAERLSSLRKTKRIKQFRKFNYPHAFLMLGLIKYMDPNEKAVNILKKAFDKILDVNGKPLFLIDKVDQIPYAIVGLKLFDIFKEKKYLELARAFYNFIYQNYANNNGVILYREGQTVWLNDTLGMVVPFLLNYHKYSNKANCIEMAKKQIAHFIEFGIDNKTFIPAHGINLKFNTKAGSINWGRGIGWYFIGLKALYEFDGSFEKEYNGLVNTLMRLRNNEGLWSQFPGSGNDTFDASTTTMFLTCMPKETYTLDDILKKMDKHISQEGFVLQTSGDTYGANRYSKTFGKSELSQGMMLLLLSRYK